MKQAFLLSALGLGICALSACNKQTPPVAEEPRTPVSTSEPQALPVPSGPDAPPAAAAAPSAPAAAGEPAAASKYSDASFELSLAPKGSYTAGQAGEAQILLVAKPPFHMNDTYPYKFKLKEAPGLSFPKPVITKEAMKLEATKGEMPVAFTAQSAGKYTLAGQLSFAVCKAEQCQPEKRELALEIDVK